MVLVIGLPHCFLVVFAVLLPSDSWPPWFSDVFPFLSLSSFVRVSPSTAVLHAPRAAQAELPVSCPLDCFKQNGEKPVNQNGGLRGLQWTSMGEEFGKR